jgi:hypothetical protein
MCVRPAAPKGCFELAGTGSLTSLLRASLACGHIFVIDAAGKATGVQGMASLKPPVSDTTRASP